jgi:hypothetical protein
VLGVNLQRVLMIVAAAGIAVGLFVPWAYLGDQWFHAFDHAWFRVPLPALVLAIVGLAAFAGKRSERLTGPAFGAIVIAALTITAIATVLAISFATSSFWAWRINAGPFVVAGSALLVIIFGLVAGRPPRAKGSVSSALSSWKR